MREKILSVLACAVLCFCCAFAASCGNGGGSDYLFVFLSVRMKGSGGTVTAVAQNEFAIGSAVLPVTLTLYSCRTYETDAAEMTEIKSVYCEDLNIFAALRLDAAADESYFCARLTYTVNGENKTIQSDTVRYGAEGRMP